MTSIDPSGHNIGELIATGANLTTREVLALIHEVCRDAAAAFPQTPGDLWITDTGELLIARSDQISTPIDPRNGVAALLEAMLPPEDAAGADRKVPPALRGLPTRLRATTDGVGPQDRRDLMSILAFHLGSDPREVIRQLADRMVAPHDEVAVAADPWTDIDLNAFTDGTPAAASAPVSVPVDQAALTPPPAPAATATPLPVPSAKRERGITFLALVGVALLFLAVGSASYWLSGGNGSDINEDVAALETAPEERPTSAPPERSAPASPSPTASASRVRVSEVPRASADRTPRPLRMDVREGAFSPTFASTSELFFHAGRSSAGRLLVANLDDSGEVARVSAVRDDGARDYHPRVSPDGNWIAFDSDRDGERGVYVVDLDGANLRRVSGAGYAAVPSWSPDMKWLAFVRGEPKRTRVWNLWLRDLATGELQRHTSFRSGQVWGASWFPDGRTICFSHDQQLIISRIGGTSDIVIESPKRGHLVRTPAVSPDGKSVVFQVFRDGVWLLDVDTRAMRRILDDPTAEEFAWSPAGDRIAYHSRRDGSWKIWVMPL